MNITFQLTYDCNLRCKYCYQHNKRNETLNIKDALLFLDKLFLFLAGQEENIFSAYVVDKEDVLKEGFLLLFFGGEATLELKKIEIIVEHFHQLCGRYNFPEY